MAKIQLHTGPGVFEVLANVCRNPQEALKQFVENAADAIEQAKFDDSHIRIRLHYGSDNNGQGEGALQRISVEDNGIGMTPEKMKQVLHRIGDSEKLHLALRGEQGIGILAFALIAQELHLASSAEEGTPSNCLVLKRPWLKKAHAEVIEQCPSHKHNHRGTTAYLEGVLPEIALQLTKERIKDYLGRQFSNDLKAALYAMFISDNQDFEQIHSQRFRGVKALSTNLSLGSGRGSAFVELYVLPWEIPDATISLYGRGGTRICLLTELGDFKSLPWLDQRLEGYIRCDRLKRTADKTAVVQDQIYHSFAAELRKLEPQMQQLILDVSAKSQEQRFNIILNRMDRLINKFLRYREKGLLENWPLTTPDRGNGAIKRAEKHTLPQQGTFADAAKSDEHARHTLSRAPLISIQSPSQNTASYRSWYDPKQSVICINREHAEFLLSQREDRRCLRYLFSLWAKETLLQEYGPHAEKVADEMVGVLAEAEPLLW
ncbi:ATP-binding protein [Chloroflexota bacterium]